MSYVPATQLYVSSVLCPSMQLASMEWKLGVAMSSSNCRALNSPYVTLMFTVVTDMVSGTTKQYSVELDMQQFQVPW